ncbi:MAG: AAA family ATPase, partial [Candidatus Acidiferrales bacterium]
MRLRSASIRNYRTLESVDLAFPSSYAAICGPNDSGKTNVVRALRALVRGAPPGPFAFPDDEEFSRKDDYPKWKDTEPSKQEMSFAVTVELDATRDIGFYQFVVTQLKLEKPPDPLALTITVSHRGDRPEPSVEVSAGHAK